MARVLIVDDEKSIRRTLGEFLREAGYDVVEADDADAALQQLKGVAFDVVVSDIILPRVTGVELLRRIHGIAPDVQVVMMTGEPTVETATEALRAGAADYLFKPISKAAILRAVANAARLKSLSDAKRRLEAENRVYQENLERLVQERTAQLSASEARYRLLFEAASEGIAVADFDTGVLLDCNRAFLEMVGWRKADLIGQPQSALHPPEPGGSLTRLFEEHRGEKRGEIMEVEMLTKTGDRKTAEVNAQPIELDGRKVMHGFFRDITARKYSEQRIADALNFSRTILESSPIGIVTYQATGEAVSANAAMAQMIGATVEQVLAQNFRRLESWKKSGLLAAAEQALATQTEQQLEVQHEFVLGKLLSMACRFVPFSYANQPHLLLLAADVTEQKLTQAKLLRAQRVESIGSLASGIAHDLNNILTPIIMCAPLLQMDEEKEIRRDLAQTIESSAQRAVGIVKQLLSFARGKEGQKQPVQARHLMREMAKIARETFPRSIQVEEFSDPNLWPVLADATQLHQVLLNLCINARDAMPTGGRLTLRAENVTLDEHYVSMHKEAATGLFIRIRVQDTGTGIPESVQAHIFESFFTTKGEGQGTGLGLTTVQGIVKDHKGFIGYTTAPGKGTTFEFHLPAAPETQSPVEIGAGREAIAHGQGELIMIVDDEPSIRSATSRTLERHGYSVVQAQDGIEALAQFSARQGEFKAVVTDFMMPLMDGVTLCRALRRLSPNTPLIVSSGGLFGKGGDEALRAFAELGIRHVLHKPHTAHVLLRTLAQTVRGVTIQPVEEGPV